MPTDYVYSPVVVPISTRYIRDGIMASAMTNKSLGVVTLHEGDIIFTFTNALSAADEAILDSIIDPTATSRPLAELKSEKTLQVNREFTLYLESRYSAPVQRSLTLFLGEANSKSFSMRQNHIQEAIDWIHLALDEFYLKIDAVNAATDEAGVNSVQLDLAALDLINPNLTLQGARALLS